METPILENFIHFIREYAPIPKQTNMYYEELEERATKLGVKALTFEHPALQRIKEFFAPKESRLINLVLTGTAGDGKTRMLYDFWHELQGDEHVLQDRPKHALLDAKIEGTLHRFHFIFDLSKCLPDKGQSLSADGLQLLGDWADSLLLRSSTIFVVAANDGKLLQALRALRETKNDSDISIVEEEIENMLAERRSTSQKLKLALIDLSQIGSAKTFDRACEALLARPEWECMWANTSDQAFGPLSPLRRNWDIFRQHEFRNRLRTLIELCDVNGFHISVRDLMAMIVNTLLGHPNAADRVLTIAELRRLATPAESPHSRIYQNIFGENLKEERRQDFLVFGYLNYFRVGSETASRIDELILFGQQLPNMKAAYQRLIVDSTGIDVLNPDFKSLQRNYLEAESLDDEHREKFLVELAQQRRRLFFRIPDDEPLFDPWQLTIFQYAGKFLSSVLKPLQRDEPPERATVEMLIRGLNRVCSGMLFDEGNKLYLTSGLDFTSARISRLALHEVPVSKGLHNEHIEIALNSQGQPELLVFLLGDKIPYRLDLMRFEFLVRVADGALPNSFSRECYEDIINFKSLLLTRVQTAMGNIEVKDFKYLSSSAAGRPSEETITLQL